MHKQSDTEHSGQIQDLARQDCSGGKVTGNLGLPYAVPGLCGMAILVERE